MLVVVVAVLGPPACNVRFPSLGVCSVATESSIELLSIGAHCELEAGTCTGSTPSCSL